MRTIKNYMDQKQYAERWVLWHICQNDHKELLLCKSINAVMVVVIQMMNVSITECLQNYITSIMLILLSY